MTRKGYEQHLWENKQQQKYNSNHIDLFQHSIKYKLTDS